MNTRRDELIARSLDYFVKHGVADLSLRPLAAEIGTSARLLVYHFESKEGLITAVMGAVQARLQESFARLTRATRRGPATGVMRRFWAWTIRPENAASMRLLLEVQVLALQNPAKYAGYLEDTSSRWLALIEAELPSTRQARITATLCAAVIDGLLLEFLGSGDARRTTKALEMFERILLGERAGAGKRGSKR